MTSRTVNIRHPDKLYIDGRWVAPAAGGHLPVISPTNDRVVAVVAEATAPDIDAADTAARRAFDSSAWSRLSTPERAALIGKLATALEARTSELASAWVQQVGALAMAAPFMVMIQP